MTTLSTILEKDFTVAGKKGSLDCPFSQPTAGEKPDDTNHDAPEPTPHDSQDPICAALQDESNSQPAASKCPIRYMNQHSPEEIAHYLETHKHELPRSHEVCVRRYQKNEEHIKKLDAKYGNLANMVEGLSRIHQPMLPEQDTRPQSEVEKSSNARVETWAQTVSAEASDDPDHTALDHGEEDPERQCHFDRPFKEVRVGESPSRPWGISVPIYDTPLSGGSSVRPESPPPAPVRIPSSLSPQVTPPATTGKCPFDHSKLTQMMNDSSPLKRDDKSSTRLVDAALSSQHSIPALEPPRIASNPQQPTFISAAGLEQRKQDSKPQMLFTGPVFIGYPIEDAIRFMQSFQGQQ
ncbi:uncharacterized protein GGS25DRAFT_472166 [Hypoxylon fragiforme]|uniref:uncharacterized protein n=1 Tax=Hypoxylon fragiforme TaxID=63214 RepID=UPI0020C716F8|nr:uncharacterized protein GGS25DRAFT_472166 [Hypoxylon fragiforme]KAI2614537.1 hypothetical protein GGS25DRAFT_472166 [Hypoxylon fragiforme]